MASTGKWVGTTSLFESVDSGAYKRSDHNELTKIYYGPYAACLADALPKGTEGSGNMFGWLVDSSQVERQRGNIGKLTIIWRSGGNGGDTTQNPLPPDEVSFQSQDLNPSLEKHRAFSTCLASTTRYNISGGTSTDPKNKEYKTLIDWVRIAGLAVDASESDKAFATLKALNGSPGTTAFTQAYTLAGLLRKGIQNYYQASFYYSWTIASYSGPVLSVGGYIESPGGPFQIPIAALSLSCLRVADDLSYSSGIYKLTRKWICAVSGHWETALYYQ